MLSGELEVAKITEGKPLPVGTLRPGEVFGEVSLVRGGATVATVTAARASTVLFLAREIVVVVTLTP